MDGCLKLSTGRVARKRILAWPSLPRPVLTFARATTHVESPRETQNATLACTQSPAPSEGIISGVVEGQNGPEAGVWVIAGTDALGTGFTKIVVTDDDGRFVLPELPEAGYVLAGLPPRRSRELAANDSDLGRPSEGVAPALAPLPLLTRLVLPLTLSRSA